MSAYLLHFSNVALLSPNIHFHPCLYLDETRGQCNTDGRVGLWTGILSLVRPLHFQRS